MNTNSLRYFAGLFLTAILLELATAEALANQGAPPESLTQSVSPLATIPQYVLPPTDVQTELAADAANLVRIPLRYAVARPVQITPETYGTWEQLPTGRLWRLRFLSSGATDLKTGSVRWRRWLGERARTGLDERFYGHSESAS